MRILLSSDAVGGLGVWANHLAQSLERRGHRVYVAVIGTPEWPFQLEWMEAERIPHLAPDPAALRQQWATFARAWRADLVHANHFSLIGAVPDLPNVLGVHSDVVSWWRHVHACLPPPTPFHARYRSLALAALDRADAIATPTHAAAADLVVSFACQRPIHVIANGCPIQPARGCAKQPFALAVGRAWDEGKQMALLSACGMPIFVLGECRHPVTGALPPPIDNVHWLGRHPPAAVWDWMSRAQVFISPSRYEPFGLAALEASLSDCSLLLNDVPTYRELWGPTATYFARNDPASLASALRHLLAKPDPSRAAAARAHACLHFNVERMAIHYERLYARLLRRPCNYATLPTPGFPTGITAMPISSAAG